MPKRPPRKTRPPAPRAADQIPWKETLAWFCSLPRSTWQPPQPLPSPVTEAERHERGAALSRALDRLATELERDTSPPPPLGPVEQAIANAVHRLAIERRARRAEQRRTLGTVTRR